MQLSESLCAVFNIPNKSIEIGFVTDINICIIHVQHSIFKDDLEELKENVETKRFLSSRSNISNYSRIIAEELYRVHQSQINEAFRKHFDIDDDNFEATYELYEDAHNEIQGEEDSKDH